jgi:hypothetical protein
MSRTSRTPRAGGPVRKARSFRGPAAGRDGPADLVLMSRPTHADKWLAHEIEREERSESD